MTPATGPAAGWLRPRRGLPSSRAVVGGLLIATALLGTWWVAAGGQDGPTTRYLVARRALHPGDRITPDDLRSAAVDLPPALRRRAFTDADQLRGQVVLAPLDAGDLVQASSVATVAGTRPARELSFVVEADWAVGGALRAGDLIDVLVTYGDGEASSTTRVLDAITIRRIADASADGLGGRSRLAITVAIVDPDDVAAATNAARAGTITVVRATGAKPEPSHGPYSPTTTTKPR